MDVTTRTQKFKLLKYAAEYLLDHDLVITDEEAKEMLKPMLAVFRDICKTSCGGAMDLCTSCSVGLYARDIETAINLETTDAAYPNPEEDNARVSDTP